MPGSSSRPGSTARSVSTSPQTRYDRSFTGTTNPRYFNTRRDNLSFGTTIRPNPVLGLSFRISQEKYTADDIVNSDNKTQRATFGASYATDAATALTFSLGYTRVDKTQTFAAIPVLVRQNGTNGSLGLTRELSNGTVGVLLTHDVSVYSGSYTDILLSRSMDLPTGTLAISIGPSLQSGGSTSVVGSLDYNQTLSMGSISATASRRVNRDQNAESGREVTRVILGAQRPLTPVSTFGIGFDYVSVASNVIGDTSSRSRLSLTYSRDLPQDWQLRGGYAHIYDKQQLQGSATSNSVFLTLKKGLTFAF